MQLTDNDDRIKLPRPNQRASAKRIRAIRTAALVGGLALCAYDAYISWRGFQALGLPNYAPLVLAGLILIVQLASGAMQSLGMNPFQGVGGSQELDRVWAATLVTIYVLDLASNAIAFGIAGYWNGTSLTNAPMQSLGMGLLTIALSVLLVFGDEILLRATDRLILGGRSNDAAERLASLEQRAYQEYLTAYEARALAAAKRAGQNGTLSFPWLKDND